MPEPRSALVLFVTLLLALFVSIPAEDVLDAAYDESEPLPSVNIPFHVMIVESAAKNHAGSVPNDTSRLPIHFATAFSAPESLEFSPNRARRAVSLRC